MEIGKKDKLEQGYIYVPYLFATTNNIISGDGGMGSVGKNYIRKDKLNKIFNLDIESKVFNPKQKLKSRYSTVKVNNNIHL